MQTSKIPFSSLAFFFDSDQKDSPALLDGKKILCSYGEMRKQIHALASEILAFSSAPNERVLLFMESGPDWIQAFYALLIARKIPVLVNPKLKEELAGLKNQCAWFFCGSKQEETLKTYLQTDSELFFRKKNGAMPKASFQEPEFGLSDEMLILFTSGSTGEPKLVQKTYHHLLSEVSFLKKLLKVCSGDIFLSLVPVFHIYGLLFGVLLPFFSGAQVQTDIPFSPRAILEDGAAGGVCYLVGNPTQFLPLKDFLEDFSPESFQTLKTLISSTMALDTEISTNLFQRAGIRTLEIYGSTETGGMAFRKAYESLPWVPFDHVQTRVSPESGELSVLSSSFSGPEGSWYATGDLAQMEDRGFSLLGRANQIIKMGGNRVSALEVEKVLKSCDKVLDAVVTGASSKTLRGEILVAYLEANREDLGEIRAFCQKKLPEFKVPQKFVFLEKIPREVNGKVLYKALSALESY